MQYRYLVAVVLSILACRAPFNEENLSPGFVVVDSGPLVASDTSTETGEAVGVCRLDVEQYQYLEDPIVSITIMTPGNLTEKDALQAAELFRAALSGFPSNEIGVVRWKPTALAEVNPPACVLVRADEDSDWAVENCFQ